MMRRYHQTFKLMAFAISVGLIGNASTASAAAALSTGALKDQQATQTNQISDILVDQTPSKQQRGSQAIVDNTVGPIVIGSFEEDIGDIERSHSAPKTANDDQLVAEHRQVDQQLSSGRGSASDKPEPRNEAAEGGSEQQQQQNDPMIIDHRPLNGDSNASDYLTRSPAQASPTSTTTSTTTSSSIDNNYVTPLPASYSPATTTARSVTMGAWSIQIPSSAQQQQQQQSGSMKNQQQRSNGHLGQYMASSSNQVPVMASAHPSSINAIIAEQTGGNNNNNNVGQTERTLSGSGMSMNSNNNMQQQQQQSVPISINGQPASLVLINGAAPANGNGSPLMLGSNTVPMTAAGPNVVQGRRVSISGLLRGLGSALANLFNRRDHGAGQMAAQASLLNPQVVTMSAANSPASASSATAINGGQASAPPATAAPTTSSTGGGGWLQLGPNAPHWLTQAQSAIQSLQQTQQQFLSNAASSIVSNGLAAAASQNRYQILPAPQQQLKPTTATLAITLPQSFVTGAQQPQQQSAGFGSSPSNQLDLQMSASQPQYTIIQASPVANVASQPPTTANQVATGASNQQQTRFDRSLKQQYVNGNSNQQNLPLAHYTQYTTQISND